MEPRDSQCSLAANGETDIRILKLVPFVPMTDIASAESRNFFTPASKTSCCL